MLSIQLLPEVLVPKWWVSASSLDGAGKTISPLTVDARPRCTLASNLLGCTPATDTTEPQQAQR